MQQSYAPGYSYYQPPGPGMYTPHLGAGTGNGHQGYNMPYYPMQNTYPPAASSMNPTPMARPRKYSQREPATSAKSGFPLKSAMKTKQIKPLEETMVRQRKNSLGRQPESGLSRPRTISNPKTSVVRPEFIPIHLFLSFHGNNELRVENAVQAAVPELRQRILPLWEPGVEVDTHEGYIWRVRLMGSPWSCKGAEAMSAYDIITEIFTLFARRGYTYRTSMKTAHSSPRLIFEVTDLDNSARFFVGYFSRSGQRVTLVSPPAEIDVAIGQRLKTALPGSIASDRVVDDNLRVIDFKQPGFGAPQFEKHFILTHVLKIIDDLGYTLEATIPLGNRFPLRLGFGPRREIFVFRGVTNA